MSDKPYVVYRVWCDTTGKNYVGITSRKLNQRWSHHKSRARAGFDTFLYRAVRKYGAGSFHMEIMSTSLSEFEARQQERMWITILRANDRNFGYNTTEGGEAPKHSEETKAKISAIQKANRRPEESWDKLREAVRNPEYRKARSEIAKSLWEDPSFREKRTGSKHWTNRSGFSPESKAKLSASLKTAYREGRRVSVMSQEIRDKISATRKAQWAEKRSVA